MVEMVETARILNTASSHSLIILDEIGRGTSTYDGLSIAWAIVEHLHDHVGARTFFATHYHELTQLEKSLPRVRNLNVAVKEWDENIVFLHRIVPGGADKSYGIHVGRGPVGRTSAGERTGERYLGAIGNRSRQQVRRFEDHPTTSRSQVAYPTNLV